ncbi:MAG: sulfurtransferase [Acidovorax sp.]|nr:sulfurtransferase [Acidovorax sp.]
MPYTTLISVSELQSLQASGAPLMVFDCSFELAQPDAGEQRYRESHIPGAVYAHLDKHLSSKNGPAASGGRHPLPTRERFGAWLASVGFANGMQAVVYDRNGSSQCARLWWMLKWTGHDAVAVLDGGLQAWTAASLPVVQGDEPARAPGTFALQAPLRRLVTAAEVLAALGQPGQTVLDARAAPRYRGEVEPLDPVAGHIPGALNRPFTENIAADGRFKPAALLRAEFEALLQGRDAGTVVHQCGSGVTALPNLLAMEVAGLGPTGLFAGSWSEWCSDPSRPVERG